METLILTAHIIMAVIIVGLILIQHGKGADAGATFGAGNSGSIFGASGSSTFLSRTTAILTALFFVSSLSLAVIANKKATGLYQLDSAAEQVVDTNSTPDNATEKNTAELTPAAPAEPAPQLTAPRPATDTPVQVPNNKTNTSASE